MDCTPISPSGGSCVGVCRNHHMLLHNNHWQIEHRPDGFWLIPPPSIDPLQTPRLMPSKSPALLDLVRSTE